MTKNTTSIEPRGARAAAAVSEAELDRLSDADLDVVVGGGVLVPILGARPTAPRPVRS